MTPKQYLIADREVEERAAGIWHSEATGYYDPEYDELNNRKKNLLRKQARQELEADRVNRKGI